VVRSVAVANIITELFCSTKQTLNVCTPQLRPTSAHYVSTPRAIDIQTTSLLPYLNQLRSTKVNISDHLQPHTTSTMSAPQQGRQSPEPENQTDAQKGQQAQPNNQGGETETQQKSDDQKSALPSNPTHILEKHSEETTSKK
jgi:hypothetical protein